MNRSSSSWLSSMDTMGIAGFAHDFGTLDGQKTVVSDIFEAFNEVSLSAGTILSMALAQFFPIFMILPIKTHKLGWEFRRALKDIGKQLIDKNRDAKLMESKSTDRSIIGALSTFAILILSPFLMAYSKGWTG